MKFEVLDSFHADYARLSDAEKELFRKVLPAFVAACDRYAADSSASWPASLRVKDVEGAPGIFEMTWSFAGPDGRATFEWTAIEGGLGLRWRRIGGNGYSRNHRRPVPTIAAPVVRDDHRSNVTEARRERRSPRPA